MVGPWQIVIVVLIVVVLFGAKRIPTLGKSLGEAIRGFKKAMDDDEIDVTESAKKEKIESNQQQKEEEKT